MRKMQKVGSDRVKRDFGKWETGKNSGILNNMGNGGIRGILKENWKFLLCLVVEIILLYSNAMRGDFVSDDYATILNNPSIKDISAGFKGFNVVYMSNTIIARLFGVTPIPFHLYSLFLFILACMVVFLFLRVLFGKKVAMLTTIIFAVHPIHVEAVSWISGKPYTLASMFILAALLVGVFLVETKKKKYLIWMIIFAFLAYQSDAARSLSFIFLFLLYLWYRGGLGEIRKQFYRYLPFVLVAIVMGIVILWPGIKTRIESVNSGYNRVGSIFYNPFFQYPTSVTKYLQLMLVPADLTLYHTMYVVPVWLNWLVLIIFLSLLIYSFFRDRKIFFGLSFIFLASASSMAPIKVGWLVAERYMFLGSLGFCLILVLFWDRIPRKLKLAKLAVFVCLVVGFVVRTFVRNIDWQTNHKLWVNTVQVSPNSHNAWNNIGDDYDKLKDYENAIKGFTQSTVMKTNYADAYHNRANIYLKTGYLDLARDSYLTALNYSPTLFQTYVSLTQVELMQKKTEKAFEYAKKVVEMQPNNFQAHYVLGVVLAQSGNRKEALKEIEISLQLNPDFKPAKDALVKLNSDG